MMRMHRHFALPRHTAEVARRAGGGEPQSDCWPLADHDVVGNLLCGLPPPPRMTGHLPRMTGEGYEL